MEGLAFFAYATAAGGALIPTELVARLAKLGKNVRLTPEKILRLVRQCEEVAWAAGDHGFNPPLGYSFSYESERVEVVYTATQPSNYRDPATTIRLTVSWFGGKAPTAEVQIMGREVSVRNRCRCGEERKTYADLPPEAWPSIPAPEDRVAAAETPSPEEEMMARSLSDQ